MRLRHALTFISVVVSMPIALRAQDSGIEFLSGPTFILSDKATAAGIDGTLTVFLKVDRTGTVKNVSILAGPIWPCDSTPKMEIKEVREAVKRNILASKFSPATKAGVPIDAEATLDFAIGRAYREAMGEDKSRKSRWVVNVADIREKALSIPKPSFTGITGTVAVRVLIGESGKVISAGTVRGHPALHGTSRQAACHARFPQTIVDGKPIQVLGLIHYNFVRTSRRLSPPWL